jgi:hypothetical protein
VRNPFTALRVVEEGVVLYEQHARRLSVWGSPWERTWLDFSRDARPGAYALEVVEGKLAVRARGPSALRDKMASRFWVSPVADRSGPRAKEPSPSPYEGVRLEGVCTLLTSSDGLELYESCRAAVLVWESGCLRAPPADRPRVLSVTELALEEAGVLERAPLEARGQSPLLLVNAVKGVCLPDVPGRLPPPPVAVARVQEVLRASTRRGR